MHENECQGKMDEVVNMENNGMIVYGCVTIQTLSTHILRIPKCCMLIETKRPTVV